MLQPNLYVLGWVGRTGHKRNIFVTKQQHRIGVNTQDIYSNLLFLEHSCSYTSTHIQ